jgi:hypothetical protein
MFSQLRRSVVPELETLEDRTTPTLLGNSVFPADNSWNQNIAAAPVASASAAILNNITAAGNGQLHPDFGQDLRNGNDLYGIPYNVVHGNSTPRVHVVIGAYADQSDVQDAPIPSGAVLEGDYQNGPKPGGVNARGDSHLLVYDVDNNVGYEFYATSRPNENSDGMWHADQESIWDYKTNQFRTLGWTSADAAGLPILPGLVRPDEALPVSEGGQGVIKHAIRFTLTNSIILGQYLYPASHQANGNNTNAAIEPPMGTRFRLKAGVDLSTLNPESRVIAQAMKDYGLILADNGSNFYFSGASYSVNASGQFSQTYNDNDIQDTVHGLKSLHFSDFEVVDLSPAVTGLSVTGGAAGSTVTVQGRNFSGAGGHLQVLFGNTPSTSVQILDDGHLTAVVPAGSGTVDVRVQSGVTAPGNTQNYTNPIFGYGISPVTLGDRFTYGGTAIGPQDPGFEMPVLGNGNFAYAPGNAAWSFGGSAGLSGNGSAFTAGNPAAPQGGQVAFLQNRGTLAQSFLLPGGTYDVSLYAAQRGNYQSSYQTIQVYLDGNLVAVLTPPGTAYTRLTSNSFTVAGGYHYLALAGVNPNGGDNTALVDGVSIDPLTGLADLGFEAPALAAGTFAYAPIGSAWTFSGSAGLAANGSAFTAGNAPAPQGGQVAFLQATGAVSQTLTMTAGTYTVGFLAAQRANYQASRQTWNVLLDGNLIGTFNNFTARTYSQLVSNPFTITTGTHTLTFQATNMLGGDNTILIDQVGFQTLSVAPTDPGFESPALPAGGFAYAPSGSAWIFGGSAGVAANGSAFTAGNAPAPQGGQAAFLQNNGTVAQSLSLAGGTYVVNLYAAQRGNYQSSRQSIAVYLDGSLLAILTPNGTAYQLLTTNSLTVRGGSHYLALAGVNPNGGDNTALIDDVFLRQVG